MNKEPNGYIAKLNGKEFFCPNDWRTWAVGAGCIMIRRADHTKDGWSTFFCPLTESRKVLNKPVIAIAPKAEEEKKPKKKKEE